ncbi:hypothetical protein GCM10017744_002740 [Streptomyces antimycoticus]
MGSAAHRVAILVYDGVKLLDVAGPAEVFAEANRLGADYKIVLVSPTGADVTSSIGIRIAVDAAATTEPAPGTFLVAGADLYPRTPVPRDLVEAARTLAVRGGRVASICTGAFILGAAGLLDGKRATTHWKVAHELAARCRATRVEPDAIYVRDGTTYTSAGVTAGIDLALALVEEDHGPDLTRDVARALVVYLQRSGGQSQFSAPLQGPPPRSPALRKITDLVTANPAGKHSLGELAKHLNVSSASHAALSRRAVHHAGPVRGDDPVRHGESSTRPRAYRNADGIPCRIPELREHAESFREEIVDQSRRLSATLQHSAPSQRGVAVRRSYRCTDADALHAVALPGAMFHTTGSVTASATPRATAQPSQASSASTSTAWPAHQSPSCGPTSTCPISLAPDLRTIAAAPTDRIAVRREATRPRLHTGSTTPA